jgi:arylsulfatase
VVVGLVLTVAFAAGCVKQPDRGRPGNVLLISIDALRADHLGWWGYHRNTTPFLDRLASEGTSFPLAFVNTHGTPPSHTTMLTATYQESHRVGMRDDPANSADLRLPEGIEAVQDILGQNGWATVAVTGGGYMSRDFGFDRGFEIFVDRVRTIEQGADELTTAIRNVSQADRPVFALFHTYEVHSPYTAPPAYDGLFGADTCSIEATAEALIPLQASAADHLSQADFDCLARLYDRGIRHADDALRGLFDELRAIGFLDDAMVVITSDHGEEFGDHGGLLHRGSLFDELLHVPLILWGACAHPNVIDQTLASTIDIAPTILDCLGVEIPASMEGRSLLRPPASDEEQRVFSQYGAQIYSVRTRQWKLIAGGRWANPMLFDMRRDPEETRNVARDNPEVVADLLDELTIWRAARPTLDLPSTTPLDVDDTTRERLEALGYGH